MNSAVVIPTVRSKRATRPQSKRRPASRTAKRRPQSAVRSSRRSTPKSVRKASIRTNTGSVRRTPRAASTTKRNTTRQLTYSKGKSSSRGELKTHRQQQSAAMSPSVKRRTKQRPTADGTHRRKLAAVKIESTHRRAEIRGMATDTLKTARIVPPKAKAAAGVSHIRENRTDWKRKVDNMRLKRGMGDRLKQRRGKLAALNHRRTYHQSLKKTSTGAPSARRKKNVASKSYISKTIKKGNARSVAGTARKTPRNHRTLRKSTATATGYKRTLTSSRRTLHSAKQKRALLKGLTLADMNIKSLLGEGAFSKVYLGSLKDTANARKALGNSDTSLADQNLAIKVIPAKQREVKSMAWERAVLAQLSHPFIIGYHGSFADSDSGCVCILLEFSIGGEILYHFERAKHGRFEWESVAKFYAAELVAAVSYLHSSGFVYRDLKPENVLLDSEGHVKLVDFGFARRLEGATDRAMTLCGSKEYVAPEVLGGRGYTYTADCWSLGAVCYELTVGHLPFATQECDPIEVFELITRTRVRFPPFVASFARDFIKQLLVVDPRKRLCGAALKNHPCFAGIDWAVLENKGYKPPIKPRYASRSDVSNYATARFDDEDAPKDATFDFIDSQLTEHF